MLVDVTFNIFLYPDRVVLRLILPGSEAISSLVGILAGLGATCMYVGLGLGLGPWGSVVFQSC